MGNFLKFIDEDIEAKKTLLMAMPTNNKRDIKKFNDKIGDFNNKYEDYKTNVKKYLEVKSKSFDIKKNVANLESPKSKVSNLERIRFLLNPVNTFFEKMGFDSLLYELSNYSDFDFAVLNDNLNQFLAKFKEVGIVLNGDDFDYTCYVHEYMVAFLEAQANKKGDYSKVAEKFEKIYWVNPEMVQHIELNFRKLINKHEKRFVNYISELQKRVVLENNVASYEDCLDKLKIAYREFNAVNRESISDIIDLAKTGEIDINNYFEDSKIRISNYTSLMINAIDFSDKDKMTGFYDDLENLIVNLEEYSNYVKFLPLINDFKDEYSPSVITSDASGINRILKDLRSQIRAKEKKLNKLNRKIRGGFFGRFHSKGDSVLKQLKIDSIQQAKDLYELYHKYDNENFKYNIINVLNSSLTIAELLHLYYSFDYFKKNAIKKTFDIISHDQMVKYSEAFDLFAMNLDNIIIKGVLLFEENDIAKVIVNRYRLDEININEEDLEEGNLSLLIDKINFLLRIKTIEESSITVEKIWFMVKVESLKAKDKKVD